MATQTPGVASRVLYLTLHLLAIRLSVEVAVMALGFGAKQRKRDIPRTGSPNILVSFIAFLTMGVVAPAIMWFLPQLMQNVGGVSVALSFVYSLGISVIPALMMGYFIGHN